MVKQNLIVQYEKTPLWYGGCAAALIVLLFLSFYIGRYWAISEGQKAVEQVKILQNKLDEYQKAYQKASQDLVMQVQHAKVDNLSSQELIDTIKQLEVTQNQLQSELKFYRNIMAPELSKEGLTIENFETDNGSSKNKSKFKLVLTQAGKQDQFLKGEVELKIEGTNIETGLPVVYAFNDLGSFQAKDFQFKFRYFQNIEGEITLPKDFIPEKVNILAKTKGLKKNQTAQKQADWKT